MFTYKVIRENNVYLIYHNEVLLYKAIRESYYFFCERVKFYDLNDEVIIVSKQKYFLVFDFGHIIKFSDKEGKYFMKARNGNSELYYEGELYAYKHKLFARNKSLFLNGVIVGEFDSVKVSLLKFEHHIICNSEKSCFIFSIMDVILDWFDVN